MESLAGATDSTLASIRGQVSEHEFGRALFHARMMSYHALGRAVTILTRARRGTELAKVLAGAVLDTPPDIALQSGFEEEYFFFSLAGTSEEVDASTWEKI